MAKWLRFEDRGRVGFGVLEDGTIAVHDGNMFDSPGATGETLALESVTVLTPTAPAKMLALWNNLNTLRKKLDLPEPQHPLYFIKAANSYLASGETIRRPQTYDGKVVYEGELGIVIGKSCSNVSEAEAPDHVFGFTCINDVTAIELLKADATFDQWTRAKSFDTFGVFGPVVATGLDPMTLTVKTVLNGDERQNYPVTDMVIPPYRIVSLLSRDMTLEPGDVICCGTNVGVGSMKEPSNTVAITIEGIGTLSNVFEQ